MNNTSTIQVNNLAISSLNVRKTSSKAADEELKASIISHGLMQNLVVTEGKKGKYLVIAGGRRLAALKSLIEDGTLPVDYAVPCQIATEEDAAEMSLAENVVRLAMHPADQFEAFAELIDKGLTAEHVATRFGTTEKVVEGRMKLARLAPELIQAYREEKLTLEALMAFTVTDDHEKQLAVFEGLNDWDLKRPGSIRDQLTEEMVEAKSKLATFVTLETYQAAGGTTKTDLFGDNVYLENPELLEALVSEKLKLVEQELTAEGWGWVQVGRERDWKVTQGCGRIQAEPVDAPGELMAQLEAAKSELQAAEDAWEALDDDADSDEAYELKEAAEERVNEIEEKLESYLSFSPDQMATAGCYAYIGREGKLVVEQGFVRQDDAKKAAQADTGDTDEDEQPVEKPKGIPESLKRDLAAYRLGVAQIEIAKHPAIAFDLLVFKVAKNALTMRSSYDGPQVSFSRNFAGNASSDARDFLQTQMEPIAKALPADWLELDSEAEQFSAFQSLSDHQKHALLAYCVALTLQPKLDSGGEPTAYDVALAQTGASVADYWRPTKDNYLSRVTKDQLLEIGEELIGGERGDSWARQNANAKKGDLAGEMHKVFNEPNRPGTTPEQSDRIKNWLPDGMAFGPAPEPKPAKAKKGKKAA